jgi:hypothetical protein
MRSVVFQTVQVLVALAAHFAAIRLLLLHADGSGIRDRSQRVDNRESAVFVLLQLLVLVTVLLTISTCLVLQELYL